MMTNGSDEYDGVDRIAALARGGADVLAASRTDIHGRFSSHTLTPT